MPARGRRGRARRGRPFALRSARLRIASFPSAPRFSGVERAVGDEAQVVAPWIDDVERALAPRALDDGSGRLSVDLVRRERTQLLGAGVDPVDVGDRKIQRL